MKNVYPDVDYGRDLEAYITPNFRYGEFVASETAMKYGIKIYQMSKSGKI